MKLLFAVPLAFLAISDTSRPTPARAAAAPLRLEVTSSDSLHPMTAQIFVQGRIAAVGARLPGGSVHLEGETGTITTPAVIDVLDGPVVIEFRTLASAPGTTLEVRPTTGQVERIVAGGGTLRLERATGSDALKATGDGLQMQLRSGRSR